MGIANNNPILDTREYIVEFMDGHEETMAANFIAEHLFSQVDDDGNWQVLLDEIIDHRVDTKTAVQEKDADKLTAHIPIVPFEPISSPKEFFS